MRNLEFLSTARAALIRSMATVSEETICMCSTIVRPQHSRRPGNRQGRQGAIVLELLLCLPVWLIGLLAIVEFGELVIRLQQVALASRVGTEVASQLPTLSPSDGDPVPLDVLDAISNQMQTAKMAECKVYLQHNVGVGAGPPVTLVSGTCTVPEPPLPSPLPPGRFVRVTVCAEATQLAPNLLKTELFGGLDISTWRVRETTTMHHEYD